MRPTWDSAGSVVVPAWPCTGWGLPGRRVTAPPVRSYRTISPLPATGSAAARRLGGVFLWHFPAGFPGSDFPTTPPFGVRTFLEGRFSLRPPRLLDQPFNGRAARSIRPPGHRSVYWVVRTQKADQPPARPGARLRERGPAVAAAGLHLAAALHGAAAHRALRARTGQRRP